MPKATRLAQNEDMADLTKIRQRILDILTVYGRCSPTMLQAALGPYTKPAVWRPVLEKMLKKQEVQEKAEMLNGRSYKVLELTEG